MMTTTALNCDVDTGTGLSHHIQRSPGVLLMTHRPLLITYMNRPAIAIVDRLHRLECGTPGMGLPNGILNFCLDLLDALDDRCDFDTASPLQLNREIAVAGLLVSLRGLNVPRSSDVDRSHICVLMEAITFGWPYSSSQ